MNNWRICFTTKSHKDYDTLDGSQKEEVDKALYKVSKNPLSRREGGYGEELGNKAGLDLTGCLKIKLKKSGIRIVYKLELSEQGMTIVVIGMRDELAAYREATKRLGRLSP